MAGCMYELECGIGAEVGPISKSIFKEIGVSTRSHIYWKMSNVSVDSRWGHCEVARI